MPSFHERRANPIALAIGGRASPLSLSRRAAWWVVLAALSAIAVADNLTGDRVWFGPGYLLSVCVAGWSLGWRQALGVALACMGLTFAANGPALLQTGGAGAPGSFATRWLFVLAVIGLVELVRRNYLHEWHLARTDLLTGALNRQAFFEIAAAGSRIRGWTLIAYADLDGFKRLNDRFGHGFGDEALRSFATVVRQKIRNEDLFARVGGDEFIISMRVPNQHAAKVIASRLHTAMNESTPKCSLGVLILPPGSGSVSDQVQLADILMYEAKQLGSSLVVATRTHGGGLVTRHPELTPGNSTASGSVNIAARSAA